MTANLHAPSRWPVAIVALAIGVAIGGAGVWATQRDTTSQDAIVDDEATTTVVEAETRDLISFQEWDGVLEAGPTASISSSVRGTVTQTADASSLIEYGDVVAAIDGNPVIALYGEVPQFRALEAEVETGADIRQLEENLVALGYDPDGLVAVDETYNFQTGQMVQRWETDLGFTTPDTVVDAGQIVFIAGPSEVLNTTPVGSEANPGQSLLTTLTLANSGFIAAVDQDTAEDTEDVAGVVGATVPEGASVIDLDTGDDPFVGRPIQLWEDPQNNISLVVDVDVIDSFPLELSVDVELPDGQIIPATVSEVSDVARTQQNGNAAITVVDVLIAPLDEIESNFSAGPVTVRVEDDAVFGATLVPVRSLVALSDGGHAVEIDGQGLVSVELGRFDEGWVEITNEAISPGDSVVAPT